MTIFSDNGGQMADGRQPRADGIKEIKKKSSSSIMEANGGQPRGEIEKKIKYHESQNEKKTSGNETKILTEQIDSVYCKSIE